ncbi:DUF2628 domain-containing protein [Alkalibacillus aidingensis]|uniref:DUF2628 domain-containing protein n=1 Tax=Alkalibacillus aidingensis TaxID=2747607 RepID=UPI00166094F6|nr:DUF2628 domain-containing protein [Alkalibacillus aidingensis]
MKKQKQLVHKLNQGEGETKGGFIRARSGPFNASLKEVDTADLDLTKCYIGRHHWYYLKEFIKIKANGTKESWNFSAFLFDVFWLIYRKMYGHAIAFMLAITTAMTAWTYQWLEFGSNAFYTVLACLVILAKVLLGIYGNYFYKERVEKHVILITYVTEDFDEQMNAANETGGQSWISVVISVVVLVLIVTSVFFFNSDTMNEHRQAQPVEGYQNNDMSDELDWTAIEMVKKATVSNADDRTVEEVFSTNFMDGEWHSYYLDAEWEEVIYKGLLIGGEDDYDVSIVFDVNTERYTIELYEVRVNGHLLRQEEAEDLLQDIFGWDH